MNIKTQYTRNENVLVARSDGTWSKAVVVNVDEDKQNYVVVFHDAGAGKSVQKQISYDTAIFHLKEDGGGAYTRLDKKSHRIIDEIATVALHNKIQFLDASCKVMEGRSNSFIHPAVQHKFSSNMMKTLEDLLLHLSTMEQSQTTTPVKNIIDWCMTFTDAEPASPQAIEPAPDLEKTETAEPPPPPASKTLEEIINLMYTLKDKIQSLSEVGSPSEAVLQEVGTYKSEYQELKLEVISASKALNPPEDLTKQFLCTIIREGDQHENSLQVVDALLSNCSDIDFSETIEKENLLVDCCTDGNVHFLSQLLGYSKVTTSAFDVVELFSSSCFSQTSRIQCTSALLSSDKIILEPVMEDLSSVIEEFFSDITSSLKKLPKENREGCNKLVKTLLTNTTISTKCNLASGGGDPLTFLARCCRDGDIDLYKLCIDHCSKSPQEELMEPLPDGFTPFMHAIIKGHGDLVADILSSFKLDLDKDTEPGTCLGIANALQVCEKIIIYYYYFFSSVCLHDCDRMFFLKKKKKKKKK